MTTAPLAVLSSAARKISGTAGIRAVARRAPLAWRDGTDPGPYVVVTQVTESAPALRGDGTTLRDGISIQASLWETEADTDDGRLEGLVAALDGTWLDVGARGTVEGTLLIPDEDAAAIHHAVTVRYLVSR